MERRMISDRCRSNMARHECVGAVVAFALVFPLAATLMAQEPPPQGRGGRVGATRDFLGLGPAPDPVAAARGEKVYAANCALCHGAKATGATAPNLVRSETVLHDEKGERIGPVLVKGRPDAGMPAFPNLSSEQVADIGQFLHLRVEQIANRGSYQRANIVTGDAKKGEAYFNGAGRCNTCHTVTGDRPGNLTHIASKFRLPDQLQSRFLYPGGTPRTATITLASGQTVSGAIKRIDDFSITIGDASGALQSWERAVVTVEIHDPLLAHKELAAQYSDADMHNLTAYLVTLK
jgi:cytochrome c oxidase cbb3-type subunit III